MRLLHHPRTLMPSAALLRSLLLLAGFVAWLAPPATAAPAGDPAAEEATTPFDHLAFRNVGPVNMSGRVADVEGVPGDPRVVYVGSASGGVWKTTDGGLTFAPIFDDQPIASIGDLALAPSNPEVIYVGTGESNVRNSVSFGDGVYKSTDGGESWRHLGLADTHHVSRIAVHPTDPDTVWVGALGHIYGPNEERGVFKSTDGGQSFEKVLYLDDRHGVADLDLDPTNPNVLFAALWHFERKPWTHTSGSEEGGVWRSLDGGESWEKLTEGLPRLMGRIGVKVAPSNPRVVYVIAESNEGTLFRSDDRGATFRKVSDDPEIVSRGFYYADLRVDPADENRVYAVASRLQRSIDGGRTFQRIARGVHIDFHSLWIDPTAPERLWVGQDGGVAVSYDRGESWEPIRNLPIGQFYQLFVDDRQPFYYLGGGLQDNGTWYGPSRTREPAGILEDDWRMMSFGDAYWVVPHPTEHELFLSEMQAGGIVRTDMRTRNQQDVSPQPRRNDGGPVEPLTYRFNWNAPIIASPHDPLTVYFAANVVFKSTDFGSSWQVVSPDLTTDDAAKQGVAGGPVWEENTTAEYHTTIISLAESPRVPGLLWAGSDDGRVHVTRDGGASWTDVTANLPGLPEHSPVSHLEPSRTADGTAYAAFDRHMFDDFRPHLYVTDDFGASWRRLSTEGIPESAWVWVLREDPVNPDLLYAGTELGLYASWDRGGSWQPLQLENLPTVAVHDLLVHPRANDLVLATHGRALWIFDDATPLQRFGEVGEGPAHLFPVRPALAFPVRFTRYGLGDKEHKAPNPPYGALITYHLAESLEPEEGEGGAGGGGEETEGAGAGGEAGTGAGEMAGAGGEGDEAGGDGAGAEEKAERIHLEILDASGTVVRTMKAEALGKEKGLNRVAWDLAFDPPRPRRDDGEGGNEFWRGPSGPAAPAGSYTARLTVDGEVLETPVEVRLDPLLEVTPEAMAEKHQAALRLTAMRSAANDALRALDGLEAQHKALEATLETLKREPPAEVETAWKEQAEARKELTLTLAREEGKPFWSTGPRLSEQIGGLFYSVDGTFAAPTAAQRELLAELEGELTEALAAVNTHLTEAVPTLNQQLTTAGLPPLLVPEPVQWEAGEVPEREGR